MTTEDVSRMTPSSRGLALALIALTLAVFLQTATFEFTYLDDPLYITDNDMVREGLTLRGVQYALSSEPAPITNPLALLVHMAAVDVFGLWPGGHHLINVLVHVGNVLLLFTLLLRMTNAPLRAGFVAAVFAIHPFQVENVAWISDLKDVLSAFFWLAAALAYLGYVRRPGVVRMVGVATLFFLSLLAKPMAVTFPCVLLLLDYWPLQRAPLRRSAISHWVKLASEKWLLWLFAVVASVATYRMQIGAGAGSMVEEAGVVSRLANACLAYLAYITKSIWPTNFTLFYPHPGDSVNLVAGIGAALLLGTTTIALYLKRERFAPAFTGWLWFIGMLVPVIGIVQVGSQAYADRYTYLPIIGLAIAIAWSAADALPARASRPLVMASLVVLAGLAVVAHRQTALWRTSEGIFRHTLALTGPNPTIETDLGRYLLDEKRNGDAFPHLKRAVDLVPEGYVNQLNMGTYHYNVGAYSSAESRFLEARRLDPNDARAPYNLGRVAIMRGEFDVAQSLLEEALTLDGDDADTYAALGQVFYERGEYSLAAEFSQQSLMRDPNSDDALGNLGLALVRLGRFQEGVEALAGAVALNPDEARNRMNLANQLARAGQYDAAIEHYRFALEVSPRDALLLFNTGLALELNGDTDDAIEHYRRALREDDAPSDAQSRLDALLDQTGESL